MNIFKKLFRKKDKKSNVENEGFSVNAIKEYFEKEYQIIAEQYQNDGTKCQNDVIEYYSARNIFRHYPLRYDPNNTFPEEINLVIDKIFKTLYNYCIEKGIIASDISYDDFYKGKGLYDDTYPMDKRLRGEK